MRTILLWALALLVMAGPMSQTWTWFQKLVVLF